MKDYTAKDIRNVGVFGHGGEGKTTLTEAMLFNAGLLERLGKVENGTTTTDFDPEEIKRTISINLAGLPGISVPCGSDSQGLPIGMQLIGDCFKEKTLIRAAYTYEQSVK